MRSPDFVRNLLCAMSLATRRPASSTTYKGCTWTWNPPFSAAKRGALDSEFTVFDELGQARATTGTAYFGGEALVVLPHQPVARGLFGTAAGVVRLRGLGGDFKLLLYTAFTS